MSRNTSTGERNRRNRGGGSSGSGPGYAVAGAVATGVAAGVVAAVAGGIYWLTKGKTEPEVQQQQRTQPVAQNRSQSQAPVQGRTQTDAADTGTMGYLANLVNRMSTPSSVSTASSSFTPNTTRRSPDPPAISNLNALLSDIFVRFIQIKREDFEVHYKVFDCIFQHLHRKMKEVDPYYRKYSSTVQFAGSHYDNLRIKKPDEFDMDIVIGLPVNLRENPTSPADSDICIEPKAAGFLQLKMGTQFQKLPMRDGTEWQNNKAAYEWMDGSNYLLRSNFLHWFKSVVDLALNRFEFSGIVPMYYVEGVPYTIRKSEAGPAVTLIIENKSRGFRLDVDLVPALKFPETRWPIGNTYRSIPPQCARGEWLVVGKAIQDGIVHDQNRSWRIALHNQERELMRDSGNLRQAVRLLKKVRDTLGMKKVASYYVKTLFFWEIVERNNNLYWHKNNPAFLFKLMVWRLHAALVNKKIPYFWNKNNNLIGGVNERVLFEYAAKLVPLMQILENQKEYKQVAKFLLSPEEFGDYNANFLHI